MSVGGEKVYLEPIHTNTQLAFHYEVILKISTTTCSIATRLTFGDPQCAVHLVYTSVITSGIQKETSGRFQSKRHLLEVFQNIDQYVMYVYPFKVEYTLIEGTVPVHIYAWPIWDVRCPAYTCFTIYRPIENMEWSMPNTLVQTASPYTSQKCVKIISQVTPVYPHSNVQSTRQLPIAN